MAAWISYYKYMRKRLSSYSRRTAVFDKLSTTADECSAIAPVRVSCADSRRQVRSVFLQIPLFVPQPRFGRQSSSVRRNLLRMLTETVSYQPFPHTLYPNK